MNRKSICCRRNERTRWQEGLSGLKTNVQFSQFVIAPNEVLPFITLHWQKSIKVMRTRSLYNFVQMNLRILGDRRYFLGLKQCTWMQKGANKKRVRTSYFKTFLITQERRFPCCETIFEWRMIRYICNKMATLLIAGIDWDEHAQGLRYSEGNEGHSGQYVLQYQKIHCLPWTVGVSAQNTISIQSNKWFVYT